MNAELVKKWLGKLTKLNPASGRGQCRGKAPHKPLLLLCLVDMAEDFPEDKYDFKPTPAQRGFAEQLLHASNANYFFTNLAMGQKPPAEEDPKRDQFKTKADVVAFVKKAFADGAAAIKAKGDKGMSEFVVDPDSHQQVRVSDLAYGLIEHDGRF